VSRASSPLPIAGLCVFAWLTALALALFNLTHANAQTLTNAFGGLSEGSDDPIDIESDRLVVHDKQRYVTFKGNVKAVQGDTVLRASELNVHLAADKSAGKKTQSGRQPKAAKSSDANEPKEKRERGDGGAQTSNMIGISEDPMDIESDVLVVHDKEKYATFRGNVKAVQGTSTLSAGELTVNYVGGDKLGSASGVTKALSVEGQAGGSNAQITKIEAKGNVVITSKKDGGDNVLKGHRLVIDLAKNEAWVESADNAEAESRVHASFVSGEATVADSVDAKPAQARPQANSAGAEAGETKPQEVTAENTSGSKSDGVTASNEAPDAGAGAKQSEGNVTKIEATGNVIINSGENQTTTSDWALYDVPAQLVTVGGNVVLTQGQNVLKGNRLLIDLKTGESRFENTGDTAAGGRIRGLFMPKDGGKSEGAKPADAKPAASKKEAASSGNEPDAGTSEEPGTVGEPDDVPLLLRPQL